MVPVGFRGCKRQFIERRLLCPNKLLNLQRFVLRFFELWLTKIPLSGQISVGSPIPVFFTARQNALVLTIFAGTRCIDFATESCHATLSSAVARLSGFFSSKPFEPQRGSGGFPGAPCGMRPASRCRRRSGVKPVDSLGVHHPALPAEQNCQSPIPIVYVRSSQFSLPGWIGVECYHERL